MNPGVSTSRPEQGRSLDDYDFDLPAGLIAEFPAEERTSSRLLVLDREQEGFVHERFAAIENYFKPGDVLVLNNTKVIPARLLGRRETGGQAEALLVRHAGGRQWEALLRPSGRTARAALLDFSTGGESLSARVLDEPREGTGMRLIEFIEPDFMERIRAVGRVPLPPYIEREDVPLDRERYQTIFASREGAVAAPTAGLHFDRQLLERLERKGVEILYVTLHTGYGTFQPVTAEDLTKHDMFSEPYEISRETASRLNAALRERRRIIACGTTTVRTLEAAALRGEEIPAGAEETRLFIYPPYPFRVISGLITNFHLPKSSLLMLVSAFAGYGRIRAAYQEAVGRAYRFYSYGDAMLIL